MPYAVDSTLGPSLLCAMLSCILSGAGSKEEGPWAPPQGEQCAPAAPVSAWLLSRKWAEAWRAGSVSPWNSVWQSEAPTQHRRLHWDTSLCIPGFRGNEQTPNGRPAAAWPLGGGVAEVQPTHLCCFIKVHSPPSWGSRLYMYKYPSEAPTSNRGIFWILVRIKSNRILRLKLSQSSH